MKSPADAQPKTRQQLTDEALVKMHVPGVRLVDEQPAGCRGFKEIISVSEKAIQFLYYGWVLWAPKRAIVQIRNKREFWVQAWAIESAKASPHAGYADEASR